MPLFEQVMGLAPVVVQVAVPALVAALAPALALVSDLASVMELVVVQLRPLVQDALLVLPMVMICVLLLAPV